MSSVRIAILLAVKWWLCTGVACDFSYGYETDEYVLAYVKVTYRDPVTGRMYSEKGEIGKFGLGRVQPISGVVIHASSNNRTTHDACDPLDTDSLPRLQWIALVKHGRCSDRVKLKHVANSNATAAVVYSDKPGSQLIKMYPKAFHMVSVFISKEKGEEIAALVDNGTQVMMHISVGSQNSLHYTNINRTSVLFVSISFIILMIISLAWLVFYYIQRFRYIHAKDLLSSRLCSAAKKAVEKIPAKTIKKGDKEADGEVECCAVCIDPFRVGEVVRHLPCKHVFHKSCVDPWLLDQRSCPMCKMDILKYYGFVFSGSQESVLNLDDGIHDHFYLHHNEVEITHVPLHRSPVLGISLEGSDNVLPSRSPSLRSFEERCPEVKLTVPCETQASAATPVTQSSPECSCPEQESFSDLTVEQTSRDNREVQLSPTLLTQNKFVQ